MGIVNSRAHKAICYGKIGEKLGVRGFEVL